MLTDKEQKLVNWLRKRRVATMRHMQHQFQICHMAVFRALKKVGYRTSYNRNRSANARLMPRGRSGRPGSFRRAGP